MKTGRACVAGVLLGWSAVFVVAADEELSRIWSDPGASVRERAAAVNRAFTNGTPMSVVIATLGTNYTRLFSSGRVWLGPGPQPPNSSWLSYPFGEESVSIYTTATINESPLTGRFAGAGYPIRLGRTTQTSDQVRSSPPDHAPAGSRPARSGTDRTSSATGSRR